MRPHLGQLLRPEDLRHVSDLDLIARWIVEGTITGLHPSPAHGASVEFAEYREYAPGDDLRYFDWKTLGRSDRSYIKKFHTETNTRCHLLLDTSASMQYGDPGKFLYARCLAAALAYLMVYQQDAVGLVALDEGIRERLDPTGGPAHLKGLFEMLERLQPASGTRMATALHDLAEGLGGRGIAVLISDLYDDEREIVEAIRHFRFRGHEVIIFHLLDPSEIRFEFDRPCDFVDLETGERLEVHGPTFRDAYRERVAAWIEGYREAFAGCRADYALVETSEPFARVLADYLHRRRTSRASP